MMAWWSSLGSQTIKSLGSRNLQYIIKYKLELLIAENKTKIEIRGTQGLITPTSSSWYLLLGVLVSQSSWDPLSTAVVGSGVSGELENGSLGIWTGGYNL